MLQPLRACRMKTTVVFFLGIFLMRTFNMRICLEVEQVDDFVDNLCSFLYCMWKTWHGRKTKVLLGTYLRIHIKKQHGEEQLNIG